VLIAPRHRPVILAFYRFARAADDIADHETLSEHKKLAFLDRLEATLLGKSDAEPDALPLREAIAERRLGPRHALDLLVAFRQDVTKRRYASWDELAEYCRYSANPVGRFVLDVHGESDQTWDGNDALCTALQVINHLQDCGKDYRTLDRVYIPADVMAEHGATPADLNREYATPALLQCIRATAERTAALLPEAKRFSAQIKDARLGVEVAVITRIADRLTRWLLTRDPLADPVHLSKAAALSVATRAGIGEIIGRAVGGTARRARKGGVR
jgi:squalene synthase HpnC